MDFFKKVLGFKKDLPQRIKSFKAQGSLFEVKGDTRDLTLKIAAITFIQPTPNKYAILFRGDNDEEYQLPLHLGMNAVTFTFNKGGKSMVGFEWLLQDQPTHVGCYMDVQNKDEFRDILCLALKEIANDQHIKDHLAFCKELAGIPVYKSQPKQKSSVTSSIASQAKQKINTALIAQAQRKDNIMVHSCSVYFIANNQRKKVQQNVIFVLRSYPDFTYEFQVINATGFAVLIKQVDSDLVNNVNTDQGYIRWMDFQHDCRIVQISFQGKKDAALSLKYNLLEVMYQLKAKKKIGEVLSSQQISFMRKIETYPSLVEQTTKSKVVELYKEKDKIEKVEEKSMIYVDEEVMKGKGYQQFCQAKIANFQIASLGSLMETLTINQDSHIKQTSKRRLFDKTNREVDIGQILLHNLDSKGFIRGQDGKIYYQDIQKGKLINQYEPNSKGGIIALVPQFKLADAGQFKTFKAISQNALYQLDPRIQQGVATQKNYTNNPNFTSLTVTGSGSVATGSLQGQIRFYKGVGKNANNKFTSSGDPVISLDTTKDGKWVLATFKTYINLIPAQTDDEESLFDKKVPYDNRPTPLKLCLFLQDQQKLHLKDFTFLPAKFDENKERQERFIVSGFGEYTVIWNMGQVMRGDRNYVLTKTIGQVKRTDFRWNDPSKLITTTSQGIVIRENRINQ